MKPILKNATAVALLSLLAAGAHAQSPAPAAGAATASADAAVVADPAVWGPYARLVGRTFAGEDVAGWPGYASKTRSIQWEVPGKVMVETGTYAHGAEIPKMRILPGKKPGELVFDVAMAPNATLRVVDADTLESGSRLGYVAIVRMTGADSYEMQTLKGGEVQAHAIYRDINSAVHQQRSAELDKEKANAQETARIALRAAGVPAEPVVDAPADRVLSYQEPVRGPAATLQVTRGKSWEASVCYLAVYINGRWAARLDNAETARFKVPAGALRVAVASDPQGRGTCRMGDAAGTLHETVVGKGEALHVHFVVSNGLQFKEALVASGSGSAPQASAAAP